MKNSIFIFLVIFLISLIISCSTDQQDPEKPDIISLALDYFELVQKGEYAEAVKNYDSIMTEAIPPDKLREIWSFFMSQVGAFKRQTGIRTERADEHDIVFISCEFERLNMSLKVVFNSERQIAGMFFVQDEDWQTRYKPPSYADFDSIEERQVIIGSGEWRLPGTLMIPKGDGTYPAVVLVHGSGPHDRDETVGPNKPFRDLAHGLTSNGIAVLCYDKRTYVHGARMVSFTKDMTVKDETIDDALAAVSLLRAEMNIDAGKIFVLGHSLGGMLIPRLGIEDNDIGGFIILAGSARPLEDVILEQISYLFSMGDSSLIDGGKELEQIKEQVARVKDPHLSEATPAADLPLGVPAGYWLDLRGYNPPKMAKQLTQPILILQGERDYQVTMEDFGLWKEALVSKENVVLKSYANLNHLFMQGEGKSTPDEYQTEGHIAEVVINDITNWIKDR